MERARRCPPSTTPLAFVACDLRDVIAGGDHVIVTGAVTSLETSGGTPLVFHAGRYRPRADAAKRPWQSGAPELGSNLIPRDNRKDLVMGAQENKQVTETPTGHSPVETPPARWRTWTTRSYGRRGATAP